MIVETSMLKNRQDRVKAGQDRIFFLLLIASFVIALNSQPIRAQETLEYESIEIMQLGSGTDLIFIPGLLSAADTFSEVCNNFKATFRCHLLQLPGFAGTDPLENPENGFLLVIRDRVISYIRDQKIDDPILVGHSLGGVLSLMIAEEAPGLIAAMVIVDSLPFIPAAQNPAATEEAMEPIAKSRRQMILSQTQEQYEQQIPMQIMGMTRNENKTSTLTKWAMSSDRNTMAQAMYELYSMDLRNKMDHITAPTILFGSWAGYEAFGASKESTRMIFETQYKTLSNKRIYMSELGLHFLMWDDLGWLLEHMEMFFDELNREK